MWRRSHLECIAAMLRRTTIEREETNEEELNNIKIHSEDEKDYFTFSSFVGWHDTGGQWPDGEVCGRRYLSAGGQLDLDPRDQRVAHAAYGLPGHHYLHGVDWQQRQVCIAAQLGGRLHCDSCRVQGLDHPQRRAWHCRRGAAALCPGVASVSHGQPGSPGQDPHGPHLQLHHLCARLCGHDLYRCRAESSLSNRARRSVGQQECVCEQLHGV